MSLNHPVTVEIGVLVEMEDLWSWVLVSEPEACFAVMVNARESRQGRWIQIEVRR